MKQVLIKVTATAAIAGLIAACSANAGHDPDKMAKSERHGAHAERMFERFDTNADGQVTREEAKNHMAERFTKMDANKDGVVTREERKALRKANRGNRKAKRFARLDANGDGAVTMDEMQAHNAKRAERRFARLDTNADGALSLEEMQAGKGHRGKKHGGKHKHGGKKGPMTLQNLDARVMDMFDRADQNADGVITSDEAKLMRRHGRRS